MPKRNEATRRKQRIDIENSSGNVFKDIGFDDDEAASLLARAELISKLRDLIEASGMSQRQIAKVLKVQQPRVAEIMAMKTQCFSVDLLIRYLARLGTRVSLRFEQESITKTELNNKLASIDRKYGTTFRRLANR